MYITIFNWAIGKVLFISTTEEEIMAKGYSDVEEYLTEELNIDLKDCEWMSTKELIVEFHGDFSAQWASCPTGSTSALDA